MILSSKRENNKIVVEAVLQPEELVQLKGEMDEVHVFSEKAADQHTKISGRGKNDATKYFLIPTNLRKDLRMMEQVTCQRINTPDKAIFVYVVNKSIFQGVKKVGKDKHINFNHHSDAGQDSSDDFENFDNDNGEA